jgi:type I restriction enzyme S subunit
MDTKKLRQKLLDLAIHGKLVKQDSNDEPASILLDRIRAEKARLVGEGKMYLSKTEKAVNLSINEEFEIPNNWVWAQVNDVCRVFGRIGFRGYTKEDLTTKHNGAITISPSNMIDGLMDFRDCTYISWEKYEESPEIIINNGDILIVKTGSSFGKVAIVKELPEKATINPQIAVIKKIVIDSYYLTYLLQSPFAQSNYKDFVIGTAIPTFSQLNLISMSIPLPPLAEQHRIVKAVDELFEQIDIIERSEKELEEAANKTRDKLLNLAIQGHLVPQDPNEEPASVLLERIRAEKARLVKEGKLKKKDLEEKPISPDEIPFDIPEGWVWCRFGTITINRDSERIPLSVEERSKLEKKYDYYGASGVIDKVDKYLFNKPLLLIGEDGANLINRSTPIAFIARGEYWVNNHAHVLDYIDDVLMQYMCWYINAISLVKYITGTAQPKMNQEKMNSILVPLPPISEQRRIVSKLEELLHEIDKLKG